MGEFKVVVEVPIELYSHWKNYLRQKGVQLYGSMSKLGEENNKVFSNAIQVIIDSDK